MYTQKINGAKWVVNDLIQVHFYVGSSREVFLFNNFEKQTFDLQVIDSAKMSVYWLFNVKAIDLFILDELQGLVRVNEDKWKIQAFEFNMMAAKKREYVLRIERLYEVVSLN